MSDPLYWSADYTQAYVEALNQSERFQKATRKFDDKVVFRCTDTPEGLDVELTYTIHKGKVTVDRRAEPAPCAALRDAEFDKKSAFARTTAPYPVWVKLDKGEMSVLQALTSPDYVVEGPKLKIMSNIGIFQAMGAVGSETGKRYA